MMPMMSSDEIKLFEKYLSQATNYLEYGSGGSTVLASKFNNIKRIKSIESDSSWASKVELKTRTEMNYINLGKTGGCGTPLENKHLWPTYSQHYSPEFDLVLIDGRFRVACFLDICLKGTPSVLFHDFLNRHQYYGIILQFCQIVESADTLAVLKINDNINVAKVQEMYKTYSFNSD